MAVNRSPYALVDWIRKPRPAPGEDEVPAERWYAEATLNTCYNALDRHVVHGHGDRSALVFDDLRTGTRAFLTYAELLERVAACAGALRALGVRRGDRVLIDLPRVPEAVVSMLACARLGAVHVVVPRGLTREDLAARIEGERPAVVVTGAWRGEPDQVAARKATVDQALERAAHEPRTVVVKQGTQAPAALLEPRDVDWDLALAAGAGEPAECVEVPASDPLYVVGGSSHPGSPSRIVRHTGEHAVAMAGSLPYVDDADEGATWWTECDLSSEDGHSYLVYAPLINGATTVLLDEQ